ncbi:MAG: hypothetical protein ABH986_04270 [archaeon]
MKKLFVLFLILLFAVLLSGCPDSKDSNNSDKNMADLNQLNDFNAVDKNVFDSNASDENSCTEDWECSEWSECINGKKSQECWDNNECGLANNLTEIRDCDENVFDLNAVDKNEFNPNVDENGNCIENWNCTEWSECINGWEKRSCAEQNNCSTTELSPRLYQHCGECIHEEVADCNTDDGCGGTQECIGGEWQECTDNPTDNCPGDCINGYIKSCYANINGISCPGIKTCSDHKWGSCIDVTFDNCPLNPAPVIEVSHLEPLSGTSVTLNKPFTFQTQIKCTLNECTTIYATLYYTYDYAYGTITGKVPVGAGSLFFTSSSNHQFISKMNKDDILTNTWQVTPTGGTGNTYSFYVGYSGSYIPSNTQTQKTNLTVTEDLNCDEETTEIELKEGNLYYKDESAVQHVLPFYKSFVGIIDNSAGTILIDGQTIWFKLDIIDENASDFNTGNLVYTRVLTFRKNNSGGQVIKTINYSEEQMSMPIEFEGLNGKKYNYSLLIDETDSLTYANLWLFFYGSLKNIIYTQYNKIISLNDATNSSADPMKSYPYYMLHNSNLPESFGGGTNYNANDEFIAKFYLNEDGDSDTDIIIAIDTATGNLAVYSYPEVMYNGEHTYLSENPNFSYPSSGYTSYGSFIELNSHHFKITIPENSCS